jgi:Ca2+-binding RTX toxin-like protein
VAGKVPTIVGTPDDDVIYGTKKSDVIVALGGDDTIYGRAYEDLLCAGAGNDVVRGGWEPDGIWGGRGDDSLFGGRDGFSGGFAPGPGNDYVRGGHEDGDSNRDSVGFDPPRRGVKVNLIKGTATGEGHDTLVHIDGVGGTPYDDHITALGKLGNDIYGSAGDDRFFLEGDFEHIYGGDGDDTFWVTDGSTEDNPDGGNGHDVWNLCDTTNLSPKDSDGDFEVNLDVCRGNRA